METSAKLARYLEELRCDVANREYVAVMPESTELGVRHFAWISEKYCEAKPKQHPNVGDILAVAVENLGHRRLVASFSIASQERKVLFGSDPQPNYTRELKVPPKRGPLPVVVDDTVRLQLEPAVEVRNDVLDVKASSSMGGEYLFSEDYEILLRFTKDGV